MKTGIKIPIDPDIEYTVKGNTYDIQSLKETVDKLEGKIEILMEALSRQADQIYDLEQELKEVI